ncbi:MAG: ATP synthase F1 subunit gamma [Patescibacteria group bacterium]
MNLRQVRKKTKSVGNVKKITRSMQLVSAIKMKKSQQSAIEARPYQENLEQVIYKIIGKIDRSLSLLLSTPANSVKKELVVVVTSNKGLCGAFNFEIFRYIAKHIDIQTKDFIVVGKKGASFIAKSGGTIVADFSSPQPQTKTSALFSYILELFLKGSYEKISILYNKFVSTLKTDVTLQTLLPLKFPFETTIEERQVHEYVIEPSPQFIIDPLLRNYLEEKIRNIFVQSEAGEHSARMVAMKNATDNANDVIYNLTLLGNKLRQEKITNELLDMVTAKESVGN